MAARKQPGTRYFTVGEANATLPYLRDLRRHSMRARPAPPRALVVAVADLAADAIALASLAEGSVRYGSIVL